MATKETHLAPKKPKFDSSPDTLVRVELYRRNDKLFDGRLSREDLVKVWSEALHRDVAELDGLASVALRGRALRINYRLKKSVVLSNIFSKPDFEWERTAGATFDYFAGRILDLSHGPVKIGDTVTVCVNRTTLEFTSNQIERWLEVFGEVEGSFKYQVDSRGLKTDDIEVEVKLREHIPEQLPMYGRRIRIYYHGMLKQCNNCLEIGHLRVDCESEKRDWFTYIEDLIKSGNIDKDLFGEWPEVIKRKRKQSKENVKDKNEKDNGSQRGNAHQKPRGGSRGRGRGNKQ